MLPFWIEMMTFYARLQNKISTMYEPIDAKTGVTISSGRSMRETRALTSKNSVAM